MYAPGDSICGDDHTSEGDGVGNDDCLRVPEALAEREGDEDLDTVTLMPRVGDLDGDAARDRDTLADALRVRERVRETVAVTLKPRVGARDGDAARVAELDAERDREADVVTLKLPRVGDCDSDAARDRDREGDAARDRDGDGDARDAERERERDGDRDCDCALPSAGSRTSSSSSSSRRACRAMSRPSLASESDVCEEAGKKETLFFSQGVAAFACVRSRAAAPATHSDSCLQGERSRGSIACGLLLHNFCCVRLKFLCWRRANAPPGPGAG